MSFIKRIERTEKSGRTYSEYGVCASVVFCKGRLRNKERRDSEGAHGVFGSD